MNYMQSKEPLKWLKISNLLTHLFHDDIQNILCYKIGANMKIEKRFL